MRLIRANAHYAGCPPPGVVGWADDETAEVLIESGRAVDCSSLARRDGRPEPVDPKWGGHTDDELRVLAQNLDLPTTGPRHLLIERLEAAEGVPPSLM